MGLETRHLSSSQEVSLTKSLARKVVQLIFESQNPTGKTKVKGLNLYVSLPAPQKPTVEDAWWCTWLGLRQPT